MMRHSIVYRATEKYKLSMKPVDTYNIPIRMNANTEHYAI